MIDTSGYQTRTLYAGAEMRPRRWYTDELAPPCRAARMTSVLWRYRSLAQRPKNDAAPVAGAASAFCAVKLSQAMFQLTIIWVANLESGL
jgi:hypothetical protein